MAAPLTNGQKRYLSQLSDRAFNRAAAIARGEGQSPDISTRARAQYRHDQVVAACGKIGLRCCSQDDYKLVEAHFLALVGEHGRAFNSFVRATTESRRVAEHKIIEACNEFGFKLSYADSICRQQNNGLGLDDVTEKKLWQIFYTVRNRGLSRKRKEVAA